MTDSWNKEYLKKIYSKIEEPAPVILDVKPKKRPPLLIICGLISLIIVSALMGFVVAIFSRFLLFETLLTIMPGEKLLKETNILVMGLDQGEEIHRSDTIMVVHINPKKSTANVISIPRDTYVAIPGFGMDKINHAYAFGGPELSKATVENLFGIKIPFYVSVDTGNLAELIDEIGGITIDVEKKMFYIDHSQNLFVDLNPGRQRLSGVKALSYLRYRQDGGDLHRIMRQQKFIKALSSQITSRENIIKSPQIVLKLFSYLDTNLNSREILGLAINMRKIFDYGQINMYSISGSDMQINGVYYMQPDMEQIKKQVNDYLKDAN
ncbi:MAG: cell envelope-related transcriptional attenuator [Candidatus Saganbacteria bacterium]|uniref:Cell envelope-related transcriptional attenuator n=1 Tax=Candidatus Saganbacteria bacterium TaxID=2575572 RepID=A0A833NYY3_UNCSA|nr:MAG: cell envelope-related transcriptional attenuator [Candidatus Saganbacteria bacterium]